MLQFLAWYDPSSWLSKLSKELVGSLEVAIRNLSFSLNILLHNLMVKLYSFFELLCRGRLLNNDMLSEISTRVGLILGLVMFFIIIFSMIQMLIDPEKISDKEKGASSLVKRVVIVIFMLGISNFAFNTLYKVQTVVIDSHVISNLLLPYRIEDDSLDNFGRVLSEQVMFSFYVFNEFDESEVEGRENIELCKNVVTSFENQIMQQGKYTLGYMCLNESVKVPSHSLSGVSKQEVFIIDYDWLFSIIASAIVVYLLFMYCFGVGIRMVQLMFLEIISPMAIVSYIMPKKDTMFDKWLKIYVATYVDVFIRVVIINFVILLIATMFSSSGIDGFDFWNSITGGVAIDGKTKSFLTIVMILALLTFAKKAPELLKELLPAGASKIGFGVAMKDIVGLNKGINTVLGIGTGSAVGFLGGVAGGKGFGKLTGAIGGVLGGAFRGGNAGFGAKGFASAISTARSKQADFNARRAAAIAGGSTYFGRQLSTLQKNLGIETAGDVDSRNLETLNNYIKLQDTIEGYAENNGTVKQLKRDYEAIKEAGRNPNESDANYTARLERARKRYKSALSAVVDASMSGSSSASYTYHDEHGVEHSETFDVDAADNTYISDSIRSARNQINRELENNRGLFGDYNEVNNYSDLDDNTNRARRDSAELTSTESYARNQANNKFSTKK